MLVAGQEAPTDPVERMSTPAARTPILPTGEHRVYRDGPARQEAGLLLNAQRPLAHSAGLRGRHLPPGPFPRWFPPGVGAT